MQRAYGKEGSGIHVEDENENGTSRAFNDHVGSQSKEGDDDVDTWYVAENV